MIQLLFTAPKGKKNGASIYSYLICGIPVKKKGSYKIASRNIEYSIKALSEVISCPD